MNFARSGVRWTAAQMEYGAFQRACLAKSEDGIADRVVTLYLVFL